MKEEEDLGKVAARIYIQAYININGISKYRLLKDHLHTTNTNFKKAKEILIKGKYIDFIEIKDKGTKIHPKGFIYAKSDPMLRAIENKYKLDNFDRYALNKIILSDTFRKTVADSIENSKTEIQNPVEHILTMLDVLIIENKALQKILNPIFKKYGFKYNFPSIDAYDRYHEAILPKLKKIIPIVIKGKPIDKAQRDFILDVEDAVVIMIPLRTWLKIRKGTSSFSFFYNKFEKIHELTEGMKTDFDSVITDNIKKKKIERIIQETN